MPNVSSFPRLAVYDVRTMRPSSVIKAQGMAHVAYSAGADCVVGASKDVVTVWDMRTLRSLGHIDGLADVRAVACNDGGGRCVRAIAVREACWMSTVFNTTGRAIGRASHLPSWAHAIASSGMSCPA